MWGSTAGSSAASTRAPMAIGGGFMLTDRQIGKGSFCDVQVAVKDEKWFACKVIHKKRSSYDAQVENEIAALQMLSHPNIVELVHVEHTPRVLYIVLEYAAGGDLFGLITFWQNNPKIRGGAQQAERDAALICSQVASALEHSHSKGVVHRDLKPENLLLSSPKDLHNIKLADFGFASTLDAISADKSRTMIGSPGYVSPEIRQGKAYDEKVDVWSLGVLIYVVMFGYMPFASDKKLRLDANIDLSTKFALDSSEPAWQKTSFPAQQAIIGMLKVDPASRISAGQVLAHRWEKEKDKESGEDSSTLSIKLGQRNNAGLDIVGVVSLDNSKDMTQSWQERATEVAASALTAALYLSRLVPYVVFVVLCFVFWLGWIVYQRRKYGPTIMRSWGFRMDQPNLNYSFVGPMISASTFLLALIITCAALGRKMMFNNWHLWLVFFLYPLWGVLQQFLVQATLTRNLSYFFIGHDDMDIWASSVLANAIDRPQSGSRKILPLVACVVIPALVFGLVHWPRYWLVGATTLLGVPWSVFYLRHRNLLPLGLFHGFLGALFYFWFLQEDPLIADSVSDVANRTA